MVIAVLILMFSSVEAQSAANIFSSLLDIYDSIASPEITGYFRVEAQITRLDNERGKLADGSSCDPIGPCDPSVSAFIDYESPKSKFGAPDSVDYQFYTPLFAVREENNPIIGKTITRDICGQSFKKIAVRVHVIDKDRVGKDDLLGNWRCLVRTKDNVGRNMELADWSAEAKCDI
ncbi:hypothetical protein BV898_16812 [Hypsibius exemplaris]|uniref:Uncharacterized protein n=1 Tax=Hypsibius exemplaris TaxID=2072580 RepID=A0A9X6RM02_HYPEX|nr:hypothetical protein BV898_16812 [Hypsibius exemplaris]